MDSVFARRPVILLRGFGGPDLADERGSAYQGFNDGTVYPGKRGDNYIYEGFVLRALKSTKYRYVDATNVVGYHRSPVDPPADLGGFDAGHTAGHIVLDPRTAAQVLDEHAGSTLWVYRYYDLPERTIENYACGLIRLMDLVRAALRSQGLEFTGVDVVAHSMGGLIVREAVLELERRASAGEGLSADRWINRIVTLRTPHRGIAFQTVPGWLLAYIPKIGDAAKELEEFSAYSEKFLKMTQAFPIRRVLTIVGTNYRTYGPVIATRLNRLSNLFDGESLETNRSDGLVKQAAAQLPGAPRAFVHKCHGGSDSLVTSRESYEIAMRFLHGSHRVALWLQQASITQGADLFGSSEFYFGVRIKPRYVDFELFHQSAEAENCYGPFRRPDLTDVLPVLRKELSRPLAEQGDATTGWAGPDRLMWEGWIDQNDKPASAQGLVFRLEVYVAERDSRGIGFSDNVIFHKQYYLQVFPTPDGPHVFVHTGEMYLRDSSPADYDEIRRAATDNPRADVQGARSVGDRWHFDIEGTGFSATFALAMTPEDAAGQP